MIRPTLTTVFETIDYEDFDLGVTAAKFDENGFSLELSVKTHSHLDDEKIHSKWRVEIIGHRENRIDFDYGENIRIDQDHPLLWKYTDVQGDLYFDGACGNPAKVFHAMCQVHFSLFKTYIPFETFLNRNNFEQLFQMQGGLVAKGPKKLLTRYAACLEAAGVGWSIAAERPTLYWDGAERRPERKEDLKILLLGQTNMYVIAEDFHFVEI